MAFFESLVGTTTSIITWRSPRWPARRRCGTPLPRSLISVSGWVPGLISTSSSPSTVGTVIRVPSAACAIEIDAIVVELGPFAGQRLVRLDVDRDVQAAGRAAARPDLALVREADLVALVDPGGIVTRSVRLRSRRPSPWHVWQRRLDDLALAVAARAGADVDHLAEHRLANGADLAAAVALRAGDRLGAGLGAGAAAGLAGLERGELDLLLGAR